MSQRLSGLALASLLTLPLGWGLGRAYVRVVAAEGPVPAPGQGAPEKESGTKSRAWTTAVPPKSLSAHVKKGLAWLAEHQHENGGWSQGEESPNMRGGNSFLDKPDVADTCIAGLAFIRSGNTPREGPYKDAVAKAVRFVRAQVEKSDADSFSVSDVQGTRVQMKLGPNIDTFLASLFLAEVKGLMADAEGNKAVDLALNKVVDKIKKHQKADGSWDNQTGWAPILAQSVGGKGLNRAAQNGAMVPAEVLARAESFAINQSARSSEAGRVAAAAPTSVALAEPVASGPISRSAGRSFAGSGGTKLAGSAARSAGAGSAGVELYDRASSLGVLQDSVNTNASMMRYFRNQAETTKDDKVREQAHKSLERFAKANEAHREAQTALLGRLDDASFVSGFGSNGGEEFLSYMNISESLVVKGGLDWKRWDDAMTSNLNRVQNDDGSWTGHHCITGRTFCSATALLVLMADRTPVPVPVQSAGSKDSR